MIITDALKQLIETLLTENEKDAVNISLITHSCGGKGLDIKLIKLEENKFIDYNGVKVVINDEDDEFLRHYILSADENGVVTISLEEGYEPPYTCNCGDDCSCGSK